MRISHRHRLVFLANPRTGSTTVREVLDPFSDVRGIRRVDTTPEFPFENHITAAELKAVFEARGWDWEGYFKFCVVRNPWDRIVSLYHHQRRMRVQRVREAPWRRKLLHGAWHLLRPGRSFRGWVKRLDFGLRLPITLQGFAGDGEGRLLVDQVLRFEHLHEELPACLAKAGIEIGPEAIPHRNRSPGRRDYRGYYDDETRAHVAAVYAWEIERFGYRF